MSAGKDQHVCVLQADPEGSLELLLQRRAALEPAAALHSLRRTAPGIAVAYLEAALAAGAADHATFDQPLAELYLQRLIAASERGRQNGGTSAHHSGAGTFAHTAGEHNGSRTSSATAPIDASDIDQAASSLLALLRTSRHVDPRALQLLIPPVATGANVSTGGAHTERGHRRLAGAQPDSEQLSVASAARQHLEKAQAVLQEALGEYQDAMQAYTQRLHDYAAAEALADRIHDLMVR